MPLITLLFGDLINSFGDNENNNDVIKAVSKVSLKFVYLAAGAGVVAFLRRHAARTRNLYLKTILRQDISFFVNERNTGEVAARMSGDTVPIQDAMGEKFTVGKAVDKVGEVVVCGGDGGGQGRGSGG
ncbi:ABC transporter B family member 4-like protein [Tanacetum coccineum]